MTEPTVGDPVQEPLFVLPKPAQPYRWTVEWRWKPEVYKTMTRADFPQGILILSGPTHIPPNCWYTAVGYERVTTERIAVNEVRRRRRAYPGKQFRVKIIEWSNHGDAYLYQGSPKPKSQP